MSALRALVLAAGLLLCAAASAQDAATAQQINGTVSVQRPDGAARLLAAGAVVRAGDVVSTQADSFARLRFADGAELALRPNTVLRVDAYTFRQAEPAADSFALTLLRGGLRTITGLVSRRGNADAFRLNTATATIGVRGTDFTARLCQGNDCAEEAARGSTPVRRAIAPVIVARVAQVQGRVVAITQDGRARVLAVGAPIYPSELIDSAGGGQAVLVFLDQSRVTVQENTRMVVERYRFEPGRPGTGEVLLNLLRGSLRALTGAISRERADAFQLRTSVATIGVRGTGFDVVCTGLCAPDAGLPDRPPADADKLQPSTGFFVSPWLGQIVVLSAGGDLVPEPGQAVFVAGPGQAPVRVALPEFMQTNPATRPDRIEFDFDRLFNATLPGEPGPGLYLTVNDGEVISSGEGFKQSLQKGETFFVSVDGKRFGTLGAPPAFLLRDPFLSAPGFQAVSCAVR